MIVARSDWILGSALRFVPGAVVGAIVGFVSAADAREITSFVLVIVGGALLGGLLSATYGVRFWETLGRARWFPW